jgi:erythromycin esterase
MWVDEADEAVVGWMSSQLVPLKFLEPGSGYQDLEPLRKQLEGAKIVGLGESTHGVHEFFGVKHRLVEFLVVELGFSVLALEASYAACQLINRYVMHGVGNPAAVLSGQHYLAWDTEEFAALIGWIRRYNEGVGEDRKVSFHGLDTGFNEVGRETVLAYLERLAPEWLPTIAETFIALDAQEKKWPLATDDEVIASAVEPLQDLERFLDQKSSRLARQSSAAEFAVNRWYVHVMSQWVEPGWPREQHLTENLSRVMDQERPDAKAILWLHNSHIAVETPVDGEPRMGRRLRDRYGEAYWCMALEFGRGSFQTRRIGEDGRLGELVVTDMPSPPKGSLPWQLERTGVEAFVIPVRDAGGAEVGQWLHRSQLEHGGMWIETNPDTLFEEVRVGEQYDSILFISDITCSHPTPNALASARAHLYF